MESRKLMYEAVGGDGGDGYVRERLSLVFKVFVGEGGATHIYVARVY